MWRAKGDHPSDSRRRSPQLHGVPGDDAADTMSYEPGLLARWQGAQEVSESLPRCTHLTSLQVAEQATQARYTTGKIMVPTETLSEDVDGQRAGAKALQEQHIHTLATQPALARHEVAEWTDVSVQQPQAV